MTRIKTFGDVDERTLQQLGSPRAHARECAGETVRACIDASG
jgi:hypothetical protein